ncbi:VOC family protein [Halomonas heilongjiangensis]|uniref:VOC family protein n=1 Tax=Halomonas heilongjiangensis TaxID=1387883 RepID=A0A2N7TJI6_9GAMM|nr:VOC family protein [Halomonas heilongjiangensis]PMR68309.1 VOC family protein [Halomonas heilongjiangensis]PXX93160.1 VOC family protein [Halomonas heilongjiangensis]
MKMVSPYLNFAGNTEEAFGFYRSVFGGEFPMVLRYRDFGDNAMGAPEHELDKIAHMALPLGRDTMLMGTDVLESQAASLNMGNNFYISLEAESGAEATQLFEALAAGGQVEMPLQQTEWAEQFGICKDKFGVQWMVGYTGSVEFSMDSP